MGSMSPTPGTERSRQSLRDTCEGGTDACSRVQPIVGGADGTPANNESQRLTERPTEDYVASGSAATIS